MPARRIGSKYSKEFNNEIILRTIDVLHHSLVPMTISEICSNDMECEECPFYSYYDCMFRKFDCTSDCIPMNWKIS